MDGLGHGTGADLNEASNNVQRFMLRFGYYMRHNPRVPEDYSMPTLYLSAPKVRTQIGPYYKDFYTILRDRVGPDYAIHDGIALRLHAGTHVVVFDRDRRLLAEGTVSSLERKPSNRIQRYDISIPDLTQVTRYVAPPPVNRCGVALL